MPESIDYFSKQHPLRRFATGMALRAREKMFERFWAAMPCDQATPVVDIGVTPDQDLADSNFFERLYPFPAMLTATSIENAEFLETSYPGLRFVQTNGDQLPFADRQFEIAFSSAVLEHVGSSSNQRRFVEEACRVSNRVFLTTPNRWFPVELHTFLPIIHWLPKRIHQSILRRLGKTFWAKTSNLNLVGATELAAFFPTDWNVAVARHRTLGLTSNLIAIAHRRNTHRPEPRCPLSDEN